MLTFESSMVWPRKNVEISWENMQQLHKPWCILVTSFWPCNRWTFKTTWPCLYVVVQKYWFQFKTVIGKKWIAIESLFIFSVKKKINQSKARKTQEKSLNLTRKLQNKILSPSGTRAVLEIKSNFFDKKKRQQRWLARGV